MLARALIVVLLALNLGVAAWWLLRPAPVPYRVPPVGGADVAPLRVLRPQADAVPSASGDAAADVPAETRQCLRIGPFADLAAAQAAQAAIEALAGDIVLDEIPGEAAGYRVLLPPAPDPASARALAQRVDEAGFQDYLVIPQGAEANAVALGSYRSREAAQRRVQALRQAGFPAVLRTQGGAASSQWWLEADGAQVDAVRARMDGADIDACQVPRAADALR